MFKAIADAAVVGGRQNLHLDAGHWKRSEVQVYMTLYYDTRIRQTIIKEWGEANIPNMDFSGSHPETPESQVDPEDSHLLKDIKIPLRFKNSVTQRLYEAEEEEVKKVVQLKREQELLIKTVYNVREEERLELVQEYQKCVAGVILRIPN